jgi:signal transduction histidine kinase
VVAPFGRSPNLGPEELLPGTDPARPDGAGDAMVLWKGQRWRLLQRRLAPNPASAAPAPHGGAQRPRYAALVVTTAISLQTVEETLRNLALALTGLSAALWLTAAVVGRRLCRRALRPVSRMAHMARSMSADDLEKRLPSPGTRDEVDDLAHAFNGLLGRLHEAFERQRRFTGDASHQLRTPLTVVLGQIEVALRRERPAAAYREVLERVHEQGVQLRQIVEMLLFLARADAEARLPHLEVVDLAHWLPERVASWAQHPRAADFKVDCPAGAALPARVHAPLLGQLLDNLIDNACKYSEPGTPIHLRATAGPDGVTLSVADAGEGIALEDLPHVFEPFYRAARPRRRGQNGVGLGLAVVERIATAFGGTVAARSQPGSGSRFTVEFPAAGPE